MAEKDFNIKEKFTKLDKYQKIFLYSCIVTAIGFLLPWVSVPIIGSINGLRGWGVIVFLLALASGGLIFYKTKYAYIAGFITGGLLFLKFIDLISLFDIEVFNFLGIGIYLTYIGGIITVYLGIKLFRRNK